MMLLTFALLHSHLPRRNAKHLSSTIQTLSTTISLILRPRRISFPVIFVLLLFSLYKKGQRDLYCGQMKENGSQIRMSGPNRKRLQSIQESLVIRLPLATLANIAISRWDGIIPAETFPKRTKLESQ